MTLIAGVNLADRVYLSADTRVSRKDPQTGEYETETDNVLKIEIMNHSVAIAVAGNVDFVTYLVRRLRTGIMLQQPIAQLESNIERWLRDQTTEYVKTPENAPYARAKILIAVRDDDRQKQISAKALFQMLKAQGSGNLPPWVAKAIQTPRKGDLMTLEFPYTSVFGASINYGKSELKIERSSWGQTIGYGAGRFGRAILGDDLVRMSELSAPEIPMAVGSAVSRIMGDHVESEGLRSVSDVTTTFSIHSKDGIAPLLHRRSMPDDPDTTALEISQTGNQMFVTRESSQPVELTPFRQYEGSNEASLLEFGSTLTH